jgi:CRISPR-associated endonuclease/helicase Cas3
VIVLDEVQTLPVGLLEPILDGLRTFVTEYSCSVVLCTATQPAYDRIPYFSGFDVREIVPDYPKHFEALRFRVEYELKPHPIGWKELALEIQKQPQVLVVLNSRRDAMALLDEMGDADGVIHLSTLLCGAHRREALSRIESLLERGERVYAICTQVIEAGVDIDFPVVYRAMGPLDRIVQVAGRCNRSGTRAERGRIVIFEPRDGSMPRGTYRASTVESQTLLTRYGPERLYQPDFYREYFERIFSNARLDDKNIQASRVALDYPKTAENFRFIEPTVSAVVPYGESEVRLREWQTDPSRYSRRRLQPYLINLFLWEAAGFGRDGFLQVIDKSLYRWLGDYDSIRGIVPDAVDPSDLIV